MKVIINGAAGRMGRVLTEMCGKHVQGAEVAALVDAYFPVDTENFHHLSEFKGEADCVIDFSNHSATSELLDYCITRKLPVVIATTGQTPEENQLIAEAAKSVPVFKSGNMSIGIAVVADIARRAASAFPDADIEIVEIHHNQKLDVPSGTALMLADAIKSVKEDGRYVIGRHQNGKRAKEEIGIHSLRIGTEVGTHEIMISSGNETITIKHEAQNRMLFADGAMAAAAFLVGKEPGIYNMQSMLG